MDTSRICEIECSYEILEWDGEIGHQCDAFLWRERIGNRDLEWGGHDLSREGSWEGMQKSCSIRNEETIVCRSLEWIFRNIFEDTGIGPDTLAFYHWWERERTGKPVSLFEIGQGDHRSIEDDGDILTESIECSRREYLDGLCGRSRKECDESILSQGRAIGFLHRGCYP